MESKLYVGNLPYSATEDELNSIFSSAGTVTSVAIIMFYLAYLLITAPMLWARFAGTWPPLLSCISWRANPRPPRMRRYMWCSMA